MWLHAVHTVGEETEEVRIIAIKTTDADPLTEVLIIYCPVATGVIAVDDVPSNFIVRE